MATHSSVLAWRIPGMGKPGGLPSMGSHSRTRLKRLSSSSSSRHCTECFFMVHLIILQQLNEATAIIISCVREEDMPPLSKPSYSKFYCPVSEEMSETRKCEPKAWSPNHYTFLASLTVTTVLWSHLDNEQILNFIKYLCLINVIMFSPTKIQKLPHKAHILQLVDMSFKSLLIYWVVFYLFFSCSLVFEEIGVFVLLRVSHRILLTAFLVTSLICSPVPCITRKLVAGSEVLNRSRLIFFSGGKGRGRTTWYFAGGGVFSYDRFWGKRNV